VGGGAPISLRLPQMPEKANKGWPLPGDLERRDGMGLQIMRHRADMIGATLHIMRPAMAGLR
jgi:nitrate/nitrite-specific signal transduction histidine kinase